MPIMNKSIPLSQETREALTTIEAAEVMRMKPDTLRKWACLGTGPIKPLRYQRKLMWRVCDIRALMAGE